MDKFKVVLAVVGGAIAAYFQKYAAVYIFVSVAILLDFITGMIAAVLDGTGLSSKIARAGFLRKMILLIAVAFGTFLDVFLPYAAQHAGIHIGNSLLFSSIIGVYICITECLSIAENICRSTGTALPPWIIKLLKQAKEHVEKGENEDEKADGQ